MRAFMPHPSPVAAAAAVFCALLACHAAQAQNVADGTAQDAAQPSPDAVATLPAVSVTAKGYAAQAVETPVATTELAADDLRHRQAANVGEALRGEPGLAATSDGAQAQNPVIRGLQKEGVVMLVDGVRLNSAQPVGAVASFMSLGLAERVEVVKGPASVLYGTGALGGVINVRLPQARFAEGDAPSLQWRAGAGFDSASRGLNGVLVGNASHRDHALMLGASLLHANDYRSGAGKVARTGYESGAAIGQYRYRIDASQQLRVSAQLQRDNDVWYPGNTRRHPLAAVGSTTTHSPRQDRRLYEAGYTLARGAGQAVGADVRVYRQEMHRSIYNRANGLGRDIVANDVSFDTDGLDVKGEWLPHPQHLLSFGLNAWQMKASPDSRQAAAPTFTQFTPTIPFTNGKIRATGVYVQDDMQFGAWRALAGVRHDRVRGSAASMNNGRITTGLDRSDGATSGSLGVMYEASALLRPYANAARGFRAADMRERFMSGLRSDASFYAGSPQIAPEKATQFELGVKGQAGDVDYAVAAFRNRISNYITGVPLTGQAAIASCGAQQAAICKKMVNLGSVTIKGFEAGVRWQAARGHWLSAAYTRIRGTNNDLGEPLLQMPADSLVLGWQGRMGAQWTLDAQARIVAKQDRVATAFTRGSEDVTRGYTVVDVGATWQYRPGHSLRIAIKNLADRAYHDHLAEGLPSFEAKAPGRSLALAWNASF